MSLRVNTSSVEKAHNSVLVLIPTYLPGYKAGGPIRSVANLVVALGEELQFRIVTLDRDLGDKVSYPGIRDNRWVRVGHADVMYLGPDWLGLFRTFRLLCSVDHETVVYLNSYFSQRFSILVICLCWLRLSRPRQVVLAPRGEFSPAALALKKHKKLLYITLSRWLGLHRRVLWQASSELEAADIGRIYSGRLNIEVAPVIPGAADSSACEAARPPDGQRRRKKAGELRVAFVSRISRMKNLSGALRMLDGVSGNVSFNIYGPAEDASYWSDCQRSISALPANVRVAYMGQIEHERVAQVFAEHDLFLFPTLGENYGHVICESLAAGCPVLISDQTQWCDLEERGAGWVVPLENTEQFRAILQQCVEADGELYDALSAGARRYAKCVTSASEIVDANRRLFHNAKVSSRKR
jgi:glycosyltransferase involved in cell wall biosynthesis